MVKFAELKEFLNKNEYTYNCDVPMRGYTSFKIGGTVPILIKAQSTRQISEIAATCNKLSLPLLVVGKGSNLLISDAGLPKPVLVMGDEFAQMEVINDCEIHCQAGATLTKLCRFAMENSLTGLEFAFGIPGSVGGAVYMNAGAYGGEMKDVVTRVSHVNSDGSTAELEGSLLDFSYRHSAYTDTDKIITSAVFQLKKGNKEEIRRVMDETMQKRIDKQPLEFPSAGSTFKRPEGSYASALIDQCGLKGLRVGGAMVSEKHAGFLINYENATCQDVLDLIKKVQDIVKEKTGYQLDCEVKIL